MLSRFLDGITSDAQPPMSSFNRVHVRSLIHLMELFSSYQDRPDALVAILGHISLL